MDLAQLLKLPEEQRRQYLDGVWNERLLSPQEVADALQVTRRTVYNWLRNGDLPQHFRIKRSIRIPASAIKERKP